MRNIVAITVALLAVSLAGCLAGVGTITAKEGLAEARDAAVSFAGGDAALLLGVVSLEPMSHYEEDDFEMRIHLDPTPGDGVAPGWLYEFLVGDQYVLIGYSSGLGVIIEARETISPDEGLEEYSNYQIKNWKTDSDAAAKALDAHEDWPEATESVNVLWALYQEEDCPYWHVDMYVDLDSLDYYQGRVNACTGEVESVEHIEFELGVFSATSSGQALYPAQTLELEIDVWGSQDLMVTVELSCFGVEPPVVADMAVTLYRNGEAFAENPFTCTGGTTTFGTGGLGEGTYSAEFTGTGVGQLTASLEATWVG